MLRPQYAVFWAAFFNFIAFLFFGLHVAKTVGTGIITPDIVDDGVIFGALMGAIVWNVITWLGGIPSSSSHALIGGLLGAGIAKGGFSAVVASGVTKTAVAIFLSPAVGFTLALALILLVGASLFAFWCGEFVNSFVLAKMKLLTSGRYLWTRTVGSTVLGEIADSIVFYPVAFFGVWSNEQLVSVMIGNYFVKVIWEALATPFTYLIVNFLKRAEQEDYFDRETDFNPFSLEA